MIGKEHFSGGHKKIDRGRSYTALHKSEDESTAIVKVEQLHPFPFAQLRDTLNSYEACARCQEEPTEFMGS